ncbi:MAG: DMT family transporter [Chthoniobacterales bacterium]
MAWIFLIGAGLLEIVWVAGLKHSEGFTRPIPTILTLAAAAFSLVLLAMASKTLPLGTAYAVWTAIGVGGAIVVGALLSGDSITPGQALCLGLILVGVLGLQLLGPHGAA